MLIENAIHSQKVYDPTDDSIMAEQELCMERLYDYDHTRPSEHMFTWAIMSMPTSG